MSRCILLVSENTGTAETRQLRWKSLEMDYLPSIQKPKHIIKAMENKKGILRIVIYVSHVLNILNMDIKLFSLSEKHYGHHQYIFLASCFQLCPERHFPWTILKNSPTRFCFITGLKSDLLIVHISIC